MLNSSQHLHGVRGGTVYNQDTLVRVWLHSATAYIKYPVICFPLPFIPLKAAVVFIKWNFVDDFWSLGILLRLFHMVSLTTLKARDYLGLQREVQMELKPHFVDFVNFYWFISQQQMVCTLQDNTRSIRVHVVHAFDVFPSFMVRFQSCICCIKIAINSEHSSASWVGELFQT